MEHQLKSISSASIPSAIAKAELYRYLNEPEESESICHDILAVDPENQAALRLLGLAITDQFTGGTSDRYAEVEECFARLSNPYEQQYCHGLLYERRAKAQLSAGRPLRSILPLFEEAMRSFEGAQKLRPPDNDEAVLRWNRCVRLLQALPQEAEGETVHFDAGDSPPPAAHVPPARIASINRK